jgi:hypothetical protein
MFLSVGAIALFSFIAVTSWADARRKEREAYYRSETLKKIAESHGEGAAAALEYMREEDRLGAQRARDGQKLGGMITAAVGIGLMIFLAVVTDKPDKGVFLVGVIPLLIGVALMWHSFLTAPRAQKS